MKVNIIIPINIYNDLQQWQKNKLYDTAKWVYPPDSYGITSIVFHIAEDK